MKPKPTPKRSLGVLEKKQKNIQTQETWYPTIDGIVQVSLYIYKKEEGPHRVCVWGGDDFGLERDFKDPKEAKELYEKLTDNTTQARMRSLGMYGAQPMYCTCDKTGIYNCRQCQESESSHWMPEGRQPESDYNDYSDEMQQLELELKLEPIPNSIIEDPDVLPF